MATSSHDNDIDRLFTKRPSIGQVALVLLILLSAMYAASAQAGGPHKLWYDHPAQNWNEALPIGNGRLGAMVFGNVAAERLQLNEETIWAGRPNNNANPDAEHGTAECEYLTEGGQHRRVDMSPGRSIERQYDQHAAEHRHQDGEQELDICEDFLKHTGG